LLLNTNKLYILNDMSSQVLSLVIMDHRLEPLIITVCVVIVDVCLFDVVYVYM
jgi:hypothetical protein